MVSASRPDRFEHVGAALREAFHHVVEAGGERLLQAGGDRQELLVEMVGLEIEARGQPVARGVDRLGGVVARPFEPLQQIGAAFAELLDHGVAGGAERNRDLLALLRKRAGDALRRLVDALGDELAHRGDVMGEVEMNIGDGVANLLGLPDQGLALLSETIEQVADAQLVVVIGALQRRNLVVDQGFEFGRARQRAFEAVAHRRDLAPDRLAYRDHGIAGNRFRLGKAQRRLGHGIGNDAQFIGPRHHIGKRVKEHDGGDNAADHADKGRAAANQFE
jgi:hypothetical protein